MDKKTLQLFDIEFVKLKIGTHNFDFNLNEDFFKMYESSLKPINVNSKIEFDKYENLFILNFFINGSIQTVCDRCCDEISINIETQEKLTVKITEQDLEDQDDILYISPFDYKINISQHLYDFTMLSIPLKITCEDSLQAKTCNPVFLSKIDQIIDNQN